MLLWLLSHITDLLMSLGSAKLHGCILSKNTQVAAHAEVVQCISQAGFVVSAGGEIFTFIQQLVLKQLFSAVCKDEKLTISDWTSMLDMGGDNFKPLKVVGLK